MNINEQLTEDLKASMKAGQAERTGVLRLLRGALKNEEIKLGHVLEEAEVLKVLQREAKQRRDSIAAYRDAGRTDLADTEAAELAIITEYLPEALDDEAVGGIVDEVIAETSAAGMAQMGVVIGGVMKRVGAQADGATVSRIVKAKLGS